MEDIVLKAPLDGLTDLYVSPIDRQAYDENVENDSLGGERGYFIVRSFRGERARLEVLAKATSLSAAEVLFDLIVSARRP